MAFADMLSKAAQSVSSQATRRVDIQQDRGGVGSYGEPVAAWATTATGVACYITPKMGHNLVAFGKLAEVITHLVTFTEPQGLTNAHRLKYSDPSTGATRYLMVDWAFSVQEQGSLYWAGCREYVT